MTDHYTVTLTWAPSDDCFVARVAELPGCSADGRTRIEAIKAVDLSIREWIKAAQSLGMPIPKAAEHSASISVKTASTTSGISEAMLRRYIARGELRAERVGRDWRISPWDLAQLQREIRPVGRRRAALDLSESVEHALKTKAKTGDRVSYAILAASRGEPYARIAKKLKIAERTARAYVARFRQERRGPKTT